MKQRFIELLKATNREGIDNLLDFLDKTDFYTAPASTRFHNAFEGGLLAHSLNVYDCLKDLTKGKWADDTIAIVALLHDICKVNQYKVDYRNKKNDDGVWVKEDLNVIGENFTTDDLMPLGHGEKSVMLISEFIKLTKEELYAIRWHMGGYEPKENYSYIAKAYEKYPLAVYTHMADLMATYITEVR